MKKLRVVPSKAIIYGNSLPKGCSLCFAGIKAVIFVTGLCNEKCYYCPVGSERIQKDVTYVNEERVGSIEEVINEVGRAGASSASLTGGDPLVRIDKTIEIIEALKSSFGNSFHIHLYTNGTFANESVLKRLDKSGLDEIRFHPTSKDIFYRISLAKKVTSMSVGAEVPAIPGHAEELVELAIFLDKIEADFLNINELEVSETNQANMLMRGFKISRDGVSVEGSAEAAIKAIERIKDLGLGINVHFCPAKFKDELQTKNRFLRIIKHDLRVYEKATASGTVIFGFVKDVESSDVEELEKVGLLFKCQNGMCFSLDDIEEIRKKLGSYGIYQVESHPTRDRFIINIIAKN